MASNVVATDLAAIVGDDFANRSLDVVDRWESAGFGLNVVDPVLTSIETHPDTDHGLPGALVHFVEKFHGSGYEEKLRESVKRSPTQQNLWMFNRLLNSDKARTCETKTFQLCAR